MVPLMAIAAGPAAPPSDRETLLRPQALRNQPGPATAAEVRARFQDPAAEYRSMPLWVWNDAMEPARMAEQLAQFKRQGIGGVFVHPRPGLMTEYLGTDWFRFWTYAMNEGKRLGLLVNIYDENSYPSGFAGGHVPSRAPDTAAQYVQAEESRGIVRRGVTVAFFAVKKDASGRVVEARRVERPQEVPQGQAVIAFRLRRASGNPWTGEFPYVDLTNPRTTPVFLDTTYEAYKKHVGAEFGQTVRWAFTDEPLISTAGAYDSAALALPLSYNTLAEFQKRNGYDLAGEIASLFWDVGDYRKVRFDYWQTLHDLWKENFMRPMFLWCDRNNLQFTGHWMEHEWPFPWITPADANLYAYEHAPGIDMLEGSNIRRTGKDPHMLFTIRQVASVSHQLGRRAFCEAYGVAGWDSTFEHYKRFGDWLMVNGVNFIDQHLAFSTIRGARKRDHPQSFSDVSAWWPYYRLHADHLARVSFLSTRSEARNRVLLLQQTTSGFLRARRGAATPELTAMREANASLNQLLADRQVDFDLGDEYMIEWFGAQQGKRFAIAKAAYDLLVWPEHMDNVRSQTIPHLERYLAAGGEILALSEPARYVNGRPDDALARLASRYASQWVRVNGQEALAAAIRGRLKPRIRFETDPPSGVGSFDRYLAGGERVLFFANTGLQQVKSRVAVEGGSLESLDTVTGKISPAVYSSEGGTLRFDVEMEPAGSRLYLVGKAAGKPAAPAAPSYTPIEAGGWKATPDAPNVLVLDYCDLAVGAETFRDVNTWRANWTLWQRHGFERPAWDNAVQFRTAVFDRNHFAKDSGFNATFRFDVADAAALHGLELAIESPELYRVTVNGKPVTFAAGKRWLDPHLRTAPIGAAARTGENVVVISGRPFHVKMELENVYLRGAFSVQPVAKGFRIAAPAKLDFGSWGAQGYPFYGDAVTYETGVVVPVGAKALRVALKEWEGSVAVVLLDGKVVGRIGWKPWEAEFPATAGKHVLQVRIVSTPRNVMGPFHNPTKPRMRAWPAAWADFPSQQPAGAAYDLLGYGLMAAPEISARK
jgi:hypothetical protein